MAKIFRGGIGSGTLSAGISDSDTSLSAAILANVETLSGGDTMVFRIGTPGPNEELAELTAHTSPNTSGTFTRGVEGTTARAWPAGTVIEHVWTATDATNAAAGGGGGGAWSLLGSATVASNQIQLASLDLTGYAVVEFRLVGIGVSTDDDRVNFRLRTSNADITTGYSNAHRLVDSFENSTVAGGDTIAFGWLTSSDATDKLGNAAHERLDGCMTLYEPDSAEHKYIEINTSFRNPEGHTLRLSGSVSLDTTGTIDGITITAETGNIDAGTVYAYGLAAS